MGDKVTIYIAVKKFITKFSSLDRVRRLQLYTFNEDAFLIDFNSQPTVVMVMMAHQ